MSLSQNLHLFRISEYFERQPIIPIYICNRIALSDQPETFFPSSIVLVSYKFLFCVLYLFGPNPIHCVVIPRDNQTDRQAGLRREPYWGCQIYTFMNLLSVFSFPNFARLRNSAKKRMFYFIIQNKG
jgi:hypothetical protein